MRYLSKNMDTFIKLKDLSSKKETFMIEGVFGPVWKMWDVGQKKMVISKTPMSGMRKTYTISTDKGRFDSGEQNLGTLFCLCSQDGQADLIGKKFQVTDNGKEGMDVRYFFNYVREEQSNEIIPDNVEW